MWVHNGAHEEREKEGEQNIGKYGEGFLLVGSFTVAEREEKKDQGKGSSRKVPVSIHSVRPEKKPY